MKLREEYKVFLTYNQNPIRIEDVTSLPLALGNANWLRRVLYTAKPDAIVYAAGKNDPLWAQIHTKFAEYVHAGGPADVCMVSELFQSRFIYLSSSYIFDGTRGNYTETDTVLPRLSLGKFKLSGENSIRGRALNYAIVRSAPVFGISHSGNPSFVDWMRLLLVKGKKLELVNSEYHNFAPVQGLVDLVATLVEGGVRNRVVHYGGLTKLTHYELALAIAKAIYLPVNQILARKVTTRSGEEDMLDYSLNSSFAVQNLNARAYSIEEGLEMLVKNLPNLTKPRVTYPVR